VALLGVLSPIVWDLLKGKSRFEVKILREAIHTMFTSNLDFPLEDPKQSATTRQAGPRLYQRPLANAPCSSSIAYLFAYQFDCTSTSERAATFPEFRQD